MDHSRITSVPKRVALMGGLLFFLVGSNNCLLRSPEAVRAMACAALPGVAPPASPMSHCGHAGAPASGKHSPAPAPLSCCILLAPAPQGAELPPPPTVSAAAAAPVLSLPAPSAPLGTRLHASVQESGPPARGAPEPASPRAPPRA